MTKDEYKVLRKYQKMKPSEFVEYVFGIKLYTYQKILVDAFADKKKFYGRIKQYESKSNFGSFYGRI